MSAELNQLFLVERNPSVVPFFGALLTTLSLMELLLNALSSCSFSHNSVLFLFLTFLSGLVTGIDHMLDAPICRVL